MIVRRLILLSIPIILVVCTFFANGYASPPPPTQRCVKYEPNIVNLTGTVTRRTFINASDQKETIWVLRLTTPVCVDADKANDFNVRRSRVSDVQLVLDADEYTKYRRFLGRRVKAVGTLFGEHTQHHFLPVLMDVEDIGGTDK